MPSASAVTEAPIVPVAAEPAIESPVAAVPETPQAPTPEAAAPTPEPEPKPEPKPEPAPAAPSYTDFKLPEGVIPDKATLGEATRLFGELGLSQDNAQKLVDAHAEAVRKTLDSYRQTASTYWNSKSKEWVAEARQEFGNRFDTSLELARGAQTDLIPNKADRDRLWADFNDTKMGDHPVLMKAFAEAGRRIQQVLQATGTTSWNDAMKRIREPAAPPPGMPSRAPGASGRPADQRYNRTNRG